MQAGAPLAKRATGLAAIIELVINECLVRGIEAANKEKAAVLLELGSVQSRKSKLVRMEDRGP